jgi:hypothetical protein
MEMMVQLHAPWGEESPHPLNRVWVGPRGSMDILEKRKSLAPAGPDLQTLKPIA